MAGIAATTLISSQAWGGWESPFFCLPPVFHERIAGSWMGCLFSFFFPPSLWESCGKAQSLKMVKLKIKRWMFKCLEMCPFLVIWTTNRTAGRAHLETEMMSELWKKYMFIRQMDLESRSYFDQGHCVVHTCSDSECELGLACLPPDSGCSWPGVAKGWGC